MTRRTNAPRSGDVLACWCALAERRLDYLTEMFESGRWRRYFTELSFLENVREARNAVETWRQLSAIALRTAAVDAPPAQLADAGSAETRYPVLRNTW